MPYRLHEVIHGMMHLLRELPEERRRHALMLTFQGIDRDGRFCGWPSDVQMSMCRADCPVPGRPTCDGCEARHS